MSDNKQLQPLEDKDYEAISSAVKETARGRWFLAEYARRNRHADTLTLLDAIRKLEKNVDENIKQDEETDPAKIKFDLMEMASAIAQTKIEISALTPTDDNDSRIMAATEELDAIVTATETATGDILDAAESVQEIIWTMREAGNQAEQCDDLENLITQIYTACSFQDITGQRINKVVTLLNYLEQRLNAMVNIWGGDNIATQTPPAGPTDARPDAHLLNGPQIDGRGNEQEDIDLMFIQANTPAGETQMPAQKIEDDVENDIEFAQPACETGAQSTADIHEKPATDPVQANTSANTAPQATPTQTQTSAETSVADSLSTLGQDDKHALFS